MLLALHKIQTYPFDLDHPVFARYPAMKFGDLEAVRHFARLLVPLAARLYRERCNDNLVLTSPPVSSLPSGANLLCEAVHAELRRGGLPADLEALRLEQDPQPFEDEKEFRARGDYAKLDCETRLQSQLAQAPDVRFDAQAFRGRHVVFVNDINVTGAQMRCMRALLARAQPRSLDWLFIVDVAPRIGRHRPGLESEINQSRLTEDRELVSFLRRSELRYTGKFVARLLSFGGERLADIFRQLDAATRNAIRDAVAREGSYSRSFFSEKIAAACEGA